VQQTFFYDIDPPGVCPDGFAVLRIGGIEIQTFWVRRPGQNLFRYTGQRKLPVPPCVFLLILFLLKSFLVKNF
jgi:hypothetical protein